MSEMSSNGRIKLWNEKLQKDVFVMRPATKEQKMSSLRQSFNDGEKSMKEVLDDDSLTEPSEKWSFLTQVQPEESNILKIAMDRSDKDGVKTILDHIEDDSEYKKRVTSACESVIELLCNTTDIEGNRILQWTLIQNRNTSKPQTIIMFSLLISFMKVLGSEIAHKLVTAANNNGSCSLHYIGLWPGPCSEMSEYFGHLLILCDREHKNTLLRKNRENEYPLSLVIKNQSIGVKHLRTLKIDWGMFNEFEHQDDLLHAACAAGDDYLIQIFKHFEPAAKSAVKLAAESDAESDVKLAAESDAESDVKLAAESAAEPAVKSAAESDTESVVEPTAESVVEPAVESSAAKPPAKETFILSSHQNMLLDMLDYHRCEAMQYLSSNLVYRNELEIFLTENHQDIRKRKFELNMKDILLQVIPERDRQAMSGKIIPRTSDKVKMHAIMIVNNESDSKSDASELCRVFGTLEIRLHPLYLSDMWKADNLLDDLKQQIEGIKDSCSVLFVCVMTHGFYQHIQDDSVPKRKELEIKQLAQVMEAAMDSAPKILLIDACQSHFAPWKCKSLAEYMEPCDVITVVSSSPGEIAWGNNFMPKLGKELEAAVPGSININAVIAEVCATLKKENAMQAVILMDKSRDSEEKIKSFEAMLQKNFITFTTLLYEPSGDDKVLHARLDDISGKLLEKASILLFCGLVNKKDIEQFKSEQTFDNKIQLSEVKEVMTGQIRSSTGPPRYRLRELQVDNLEKHINVGGRHFANVNFANTLLFLYFWVWGFVVGVLGVTGLFVGLVVGFILVLAKCYWQNVADPINVVAVISCAKGNELDRARPNLRGKFLETLLDEVNIGDPELSTYNILKESCRKLEESREDFTMVKVQTPQTSHDLTKTVVNLARLTRDAGIQQPNEG